MGFAEPRHLYLFIPLLILIGAGISLKWYLSRTFEEFFKGETVSVAGLGPRRSWMRGGLLSAAFAAMVSASGDPFIASTVQAPGVMAIVDISQSMWCEDYLEQGNPRSRLEVAKRNLLSLLDAMPPEGRFGLSVFAGRNDPVLILTHPRPVERARKDLQSMVRAIRYHWTWEDGSNIDQALAVFGKILKENRSHYGDGSTLVVLTDGEETRGFVVHEATPDLALFKGVRVIFAGLGTEAGAPVPEFDEHWKFKQYRQKYDGTTIISRLDDKNLGDLAARFGGSYRPIKTDSDLKTIFEEKVFDSARYESRVDVSWALWLASLVLLVVSMMI
jgi:hypothetical protein